MDNVSLTLDSTSRNDDSAKPEGQAGQGLERTSESAGGTGTEIVAPTGGIRGLGKSLAESISSLISPEVRMVTIPEMVMSLQDQVNELWTYLLLAFFIIGMLLVLR